MLFLFRKYELTPKMQEYLRLKNERRTQPEIAAMWGVSLFAVRKLSYRINKRLRTR